MYHSDKAQPPVTGAAVLATGPGVTVVPRQTVRAAWCGRWNKLSVGMVAATGRRMDAQGMAGNRW
ncbi:MAG: hypothetical protein NVSMB4_02560 [Acidimicrobiales bacterium]